MKFIDNPHKDFYKKYEEDYCKNENGAISKARRAAFYLLGMTEVTRMNIHKVLEFQESNIGHQGNELIEFINSLESRADKSLVRLAVNLLDSSTVQDYYITKPNDISIMNISDMRENLREYSVDKIFVNGLDKSYTEYFIEALKLKFL